jgi:BirA family biotin operon repressor/biotin-[acetyl-CoA-carboxylase] ligase
LNLPDELAVALREAGSRLGPFARRVAWYPTVSSTNDIAARLAEDGAEEGVVIVADAQSAGRGRHGRAWASPAGAGLYVSTVLRPSPESAPLLTLTAGVALTAGIETATGLATWLKWPNDVYAGGRKLAGILAEGGSTPGASASAPVGHGVSRSTHVVLGFGINVMPAAYPPEVAARATSLEGELGRAVDRGRLLAACLTSLASRYQELQRGGRASIVEAWRVRAAPMLRRPVAWEHQGSPARGVAENIDDSGALLVRTESGVVRVISGEVRWL